MTKRLIKPVFGEVCTIDNLIVARIRTKTGRTYVHTNEGRGFPSRFFALEFVNRTMREGAVAGGYVRV